MEHRHAAAPLHSVSFPAMGTACTLHLYAPTVEIADEAAGMIIDEVERIEAKYSRYRPDSELSRVNAAATAGGFVDVDDETAVLLDYAFACHRTSGGLFDITTGILRRVWDFEAAVPPAPADVAALLPLVGMGKLTWMRPRLAFPVAGMELDFGGIGKEYAADRAGAICTARGIRHGLIDLGGDLRIVGPHPDGRPWIIDIRDARDPSRAAARIALEDGALATSGDYERWFDFEGRRYCHILDPRTGWPASGLRSVSIHADRCLLAGSLATIAMLQGRSGVDWLEGRGVRYHAVDDDGRQLCTLPADAQIE